MKWFTRDWIAGDPALESDANVFAAYQAHLSKIWHRLPEGVRAFARPSDERMSVHDACVDVAQLDEDARQLSLVLRSGNLQSGYGRLHLEFVGFELHAPTIEELIEILRDPATQFGYEEVDFDPGSGTTPLSVRFILFPTGELEIRCERLEASLEPLAEESRVGCRHSVRVRP